MLRARPRSERGNLTILKHNTAICYAHDYCPSTESLQNDPVDFRHVVGREQSVY